jgi:hypothetical protein
VDGNIDGVEGAGEVCRLEDEWRVSVRVRKTVVVAWGL